MKILKQLAAWWGRRRLQRAVELLNAMAAAHGYPPLSAEQWLERSPRMAAYSMAAGLTLAEADEGFRRLAAAARMKR